MILISSEEVLPMMIGAGAKSASLDDILGSEVRNYVVFWEIEQCFFVRTNFCAEK